MYPPACSEEIKQGTKFIIGKWIQIIALKEDDANGHDSGLRSAQTAKILPIPIPGEARSAIDEVLTFSRATRRLWSLSTATTVQPRAANAMAFRPYPHAASSTGLLPTD